MSAPEPKISLSVDKNAMNVDDPEIAESSVPLAPPSKLQVPSTVISDCSSGNSSLKKRYYREEWKILENDKNATEDRLQNLVIDNKDPWGMWCKACTQFAAELGLKYVTNFVKNFPQVNPPRPKKETVNIHFSSLAHTKCSEYAKVHKESVTTAPLYKKITEINSQTLQKMKNIMRIVFYFAIKDRAGNEFSSECMLQKLNGVDLGNTYQNNISFSILLKYVAMSLQKDIIDKLNKTKYIAIMTDGSTTKKSYEYEALIARHVNTENSSISNSFVGLCKIENSNAVGLADAIKECLNCAGMLNWQEKLVCMTVDGAAVNIGKHNGLIKLIDSPIHIHCYNHVLDLCLKVSIKENFAANKVIAFLRTISSFYRTSPKLTRELHRAGDALKIQIISFKPICDTRWADSLKNAVTAVIRNYAAVVQHLTDIVSEHSSKYANNIKATAKGLLQDLTTYETLHFFHAFADFVCLYSIASKYLETADINIVQAEDCMRNLQMDLVKFGAFGQLKSSSQKHLSTFLALLNDCSSDHVSFHNITLQKEKLKRNCSSSKGKDQNHFRELCEKSTAIMKTRCFNNDKHSVLLRILKVLNTAYYPPILTENFGESELTDFCKIFDIPINDAIVEWRELRVILSENFRPEINLNDLHEKLQTNSFKNMKEISNIVEIILTIPPSNAEVERIWSNVNLILDDRSLSMGKDTLQYRLQIKHSKMTLEEFDPTSSVNLWWSDGIRSRRPNFSI